MGSAFTSGLHSDRDHLSLLPKVRLDIWNLHLNTAASWNRCRRNRSYIHGRPRRSRGTQRTPYWETRSGSLSTHSLTLYQPRRCKISTRSLQLVILEVGSGRPPWSLTLFTPKTSCQKARMNQPRAQTGQSRRITLWRRLPNQLWTQSDTRKLIQSYQQEWQGRPSKKQTPTSWSTS